LPWPSNCADLVAGGGEGFSQRDFALRNTSWAVSEIHSNRRGTGGLRDGFQAYICADTSFAAEKVALGTPEEESTGLRRIARLYGADLVGITEIDGRWHFIGRPETPACPRCRTNCPRDFPTYSSWATGCTSPCRNPPIGAGRRLDGPRALGRGGDLRPACGPIPGPRLPRYSMNDTALVISCAIKAGRGEYGCNQMVFTPEFGPRALLEGVDRPAVGE